MGSGATVQEIIEMPQGGDGLSELNHKVQVAFSTAYDLLDQLEAVTNQRKAFIYVSSGYTLNPLKESRLKAEQQKYADMNGKCVVGPERSEQHGVNNQSTDGQSTRTMPPGARRWSSRRPTVRQLAELIRAANRANVAFYPVDPRGLMAGPDSASLNVQIPYADWRDFVTMTTSTLRSLAEKPAASPPSNERSEKWMQQLDNATSDYYMLLYQSTNPDPFHLSRKIECALKQPGVRLEPGRDYKPYTS